MLLITENKESTLHRWASTVWERVRKDDRTDKGPSEEQIEIWWRGIEKGDRE